MHDFFMHVDTYVYSFLLSSTKFYTEVSCIMQSMHKKQQLKLKFKNRQRNINIAYKPI